MRKPKRLLLCALLTAAAYPQDELPTQVTVQNRSGELPYSATIGTQTEHVEVSGGNLIVSIPIARVPGRHMDYEFVLTYDARFWVTALRGGSAPYEIWNIEQRGYLPQFSNGLWATNMPRLSYTYYTRICNTSDPDAINGVFPGNAGGTTNYIYHDATGAKHPLAIGYDYAECEIGSYYLNNARGPDLTGEGMLGNLNPRGGGYFDHLTFPDGTTNWAGGAIAVDNTTSTVHIGVPSYLDVYGNSKAEDPSGGVDTLGRNLVSRTDSTNQTVFNVNDASGTQRAYTVNYIDLAISTNFNIASIYGGNIREFVGTRKAISSVLLPNGQSYQFKYDAYGYITELDFPTGAIAQYSWTNDPREGVRYVTSRTILVNGQSAPWNFSRSFGNQDECAPFAVSSSCVKILVTDPLQNQTAYIRNDMGDGPNITKVRVFQGSESGTPLREYDIAYLFDSNVGASVSLPTAITTKLQNGLVSEKDFTYDQATFDYYQCPFAEPWECTQDNTTIVNVGVSTSRGNVLTVKEFDWDQANPGPLLRTTTNDYQHDANANYATANIVDKISRQTITDGSGTIVAKTEYEYDNATQTGPYLGSATKVSRWRNTDGAMLATTYTYDPFGNITSITDPLQNKTTWAYDDNWTSGNSSCVPSSNSHAYVTQRTDALGHRIKITRYPCTGQIQAHQDENELQAGRAGTTYTYDLMNRPLTANYEDGGQTSSCYSEVAGTGCSNAANPLEVVTTKKITGSLNLVTTAVLDGLGRPIQKQVNSDPGGVDYVDTTYDALGHITALSNPYRSTSDPTYGGTQTVYDALGRVTQVTKQDGSVVRNAYEQPAAVSTNADCTTTTDEAGRPRRACSDGLGRLIEVDEPQATSLGTNASASVTISRGLQSTEPGAPAAAGSAMISSPDASGIGHVYYLDANSHIIDVGFQYGGPLQSQDVTALSGGVPAAAGSQLSSFGVRGSTTFVILYQGANQHIYQMYWNGSVWSNGDLTAFAGASMMGASGTALTSYLDSPYEHDFYQGTDNHLYELRWTGSTMLNLDMTTLAGAPPAAAGSKLALFSWTQAQSFTVLYEGANQHIYQIVFWNGTTWSSGDLTALAGTSMVGLPGAALATYRDDPYEHDFYQGTDNHLYELRWTGSSMLNLDMTTLAGAPPAAAGSKLALFSWPQPQSFTVLYEGLNQHIYQIVFWNGTTWSSADLTALAGTSMVALPGAALSTYLDNPYEHHFYQGTDNHVYELLWTGSNTLNLDMTSSAVSDSGTVTLNVGGFSATACFGASTNSACTGQPVNSTPGQVAFALAQAINVLSSPATATVSGSTISLVWKTSGSVTPAVSALSTVHDQPSVFPNPSFTSPATSFGGGAGGALSNPYTTLYSYDALGNLREVNQKGDGSMPARVRTFTYDSLSRLLTAQNPESGTISYSYDANGNLLQKTSPAANQTGTATQTINYCYDALNRVTGRAYSAQSCPLSSPVVTYGYDSGTNAIGKLTSLTDQAGSALYTYDVLGRIAGETRIISGVGKNMSYTYNLDSSLRTLTNPSGAVITYTPDSAGRDVSAVDNGSGINYVTGALYGPDSSLTGFVSGQSGSFSGITNSFTYNKRLQPVNMSAVSPTATVFNLNYDFHVGAGDNGNVWGITNNKDTSRNQSFTYDALNRLISAQNAGTDCSKTTVNGRAVYWGNNYGYDAWGNLLEKTVTKCSAENLSVTALANNQLSGYGYDAAGNMTHDATANLNYTYDQENRITGAAGYTYTYDGDGNRVKKSNGSTGTLYWYMSPGIVAESDLNGNLTSEYVFFNGERVARRDGPNGSGGVFYYFSDHLKTTDIVTDAQGNIKNESDFYPWGGELQFLANDSNHYKFTGKERDTESGLDYFGARYYSNGLGRFITPDWSAVPVAVPYADLTDPQSLNQYSYVRNIPTSKVDADGHACPPCIDEIVQFALDHPQVVAAVAGPLVESAVPTVSAAGPAAVLAAPSVGAMAFVASQPPMQNTPDGSPNLILDALNPSFQPAPPAPQTATGGNGARDGGNNTTAVSPGPDGMKSGSSNSNGAGKPFNESTKDGARAESGDKCVFCGKNTTREPGPDQSNIDHADAKSRGGDNSPNNAQNTCRTCNQDKGTRSTDEYLKHRQDNPQQYNHEPH